MTRHQIGVAVAALFVAMLLAGCSDPADPSAKSDPTAPTDEPAGTDAPTTSSAASETTTSGAVPSAPVDRLVVAPPDPAVPPYVRDRFGDDWDYDPASGCNTRERVLIEESLVPPAVDDRCRPSAGRWHSVYDDVVTDDPADLEIDHFVPLADAWRSGAHRWDDARRRAFANHIDDPEELIAVTSSTNRSKSDSTPDEWLPPDRDSWCAYATAWVEVKLRWELTVTPAEKSTLVNILNGC